MNLEAALREFFEILFPDLGGGFIEFRFLGLFGDVDSFFFSSVDDAVKAAHEAAKNPTDANAYFGVCPRSERRGDKSAVRLVHALWADLDAKDFAGGKPEALDRLRRHSLPPTVIVDSGNGLHPYWRLKTPIAIDGPDTIALVERHLKSLSRSLGADTKAAELARILRVPGTLNLKNLSSPTRVTIVEYDPERRWDLADFALLPALVEPADMTTNQPGWICEALAGIRDGNRNDTFTKIAGRLHRGGWTAPDIITLLLPHAELVQFPITELKGLVEGLARRYPAGDSSTSRAEMQGPGQSADLERFSSIAVGMHDFLKRKIEKPLGLLGGGLLSAGQVALLVGRGGIGKSWVSLTIGRSIARGEPFHGIPTPEGGAKVGILELEDHAYDYQQRLAAIASASGGSDERDNRLEIVTRPDLQDAVRVSDPATIAAIVHWIRKSELKVLIVDALKDAHDCDENSNQQMGQIMAALALICNQTGCAIVLLHHEPKPTSDGHQRDDLASVRGASQIGDNARCIMRLKLHPSGLRTLIFVKASHGVCPPPIWLSQDKETGLFTFADAPEEVKKKNVEKVRLALDEAGSAGLSTKEIEEKTKLSRSTVYDHLNTIGALKVEGKPGRYCLPSGESESGQSDTGLDREDNDLGDSESPSSESGEIPPSGVRSVRPKGRTARTDADPVSVRADEQLDLNSPPEGAT